MQFTLDMGEGHNQIRAYEAGNIKINDKVYHTNIVVTPDALDPKWPPQSCAQITAEHLQAIFAFKPEIVLIGSGAKMQFLPNHILAPLHAKHIGVESMTTPAACRTYNILMTEGRNVAAALIV